MSFFFPTEEIWAAFSSLLGNVYLCKSGNSHISGKVAQSCHLTNLTCVGVKEEQLLSGEIPCGNHPRAESTWQAALAQSRAHISRIWLLWPLIKSHLFIKLQPINMQSFKNLCYCVFGTESHNGLGWKGSKRPPCSNPLPWRQRNFDMPEALWENSGTIFSLPIKPRLHFFNLCWEVLLKTEIQTLDKT